MEPLTVTLRGDGAPADLVGGKAAALDRMIGWGLPVPDAGVVTTAAYRRVACGMVPFLDDLRRCPDPDPDRYDADRARVERTFLEVALDPGVERDIRRLAERVAGGGRLAVRSSATAEDATDASYAGQYESFLDVEPDEVIEAVRRTWASLWAPGVRAYRRARGDDDGDVAMAAVIMRMVDAEQAGVVFTVDPTEPGDHLRVELVRGVAEGLVSGAATPTVHRVPRPVGDPGGADVDPVLGELARVAVDAERRFGAPQDIEWAHDGRRLWLVQSRPITTATPHADTGGGDDFDVAPRPEATYASVGLAEMLPGVLPPLLWSINGHALEEALRSLLDELGVDLPELGPEALVARIRGRAALDVDLLTSAVATVPGASAAEIERQYFGQAADPADADRKPSRRTGLRGAAVLGRLARLRRRFRSDAAVAVAAVDEIVATAPDHRLADPAALRAYWHQLCDLGIRITATEVAVAATAAASYRAVEVFLEGRLGEEASELTQRLTAGAVGVDASPLVSPDLVRSLLADPHLADLVAAHREPDELRSALSGVPAGRRILDVIAEDAARAASTTVFAGPTWGEEGDEAALAALGQAVRRDRRLRHSEAKDPTELLREVERRLSASLRWKLTRVVTGQLLDVRIRLLRRLVADAREFLALRERTKAALLRLGGEARRTSTALAEHLVERGALERADDVVLLHLAELDAALDGNPPTRAVLRARREALERAEAAPPLPLRFSGTGAGVVAAGEDGADVRLGGEGGPADLVGWGASPGVHEGRVCVVRDRRRAGLREGDVLVATSTDPSWTPLILSAGAVVVEQGGPLSHAAIVAREFDVPAVLNVAGAVERLDGVERVRVDGTSGSVSVVGADGEPGLNGDGPR